MPVGYLFLVVGFVLARQVAVGRVSEIPGDSRDLFLSFMSNDMAGVKEVFSRRGQNAPAGELGSAPAGVADNALLNEVMRLGNAANGYRLGSTGPSYFDCSGLVWRAMRNLGIYNGPRFTTSTFATIANKQGWVQVDTPAVGNIVLWPTHHMGVSTGGDGMYSARSKSKGIGESTISGDSGYFGSEAMFYSIGGSKTGSTFATPHAEPGTGGSGGANGGGGSY